MPFCTELMDIIRLMAIDKNEKFYKAWEVMCAPDVFLEGKRFKFETRFFYYPDSTIKHFLSYRDISIYLNLDLYRILYNDFTDELIKKIQFLMPIYEFLLSASESISEYPINSEKLTRWSIHPSEYRKLNGGI